MSFEIKVYLSVIHGTAHCSRWRQPSEDHNLITGCVLCRDIVQLEFPPHAAIPRRCKIKFLAMRYNRRSVQAWRGSASIIRRRWWHGLRGTALSRDHADVEASASDLSQETPIHKQKFLQTVFGSPMNILPSWPEAQCFLDSIEKQFSDSSGSCFEPLFGKLGLEYPGDRWQFLARVAGAIKAASPNDPSIDDVLAATLTQPLPAVARLPRKQLNVFRLSIFKCLSLLSLLFDARTDRGGDKFYVDLQTSRGKICHEQNIEGASRPISRLIQGFPHLLPTFEQISSSIRKQQNDQIYATNLNVYSLRLVSKIKIHWSSVMGSHLQFDPLNRELTLFRFPSFCALSCLAGPYGLDTDRILAQNFKGFDDNAVALVKLKREILLSYRLLFGQTSRSQVFFRSHERKRVSRDPDQFDPLLDVLCGKSTGKALAQLPSELWPDSCVDHDGKLLEQDVYSLAIDFPMLGPRLLAVQEFDLRQQPSRIRDLWRDRRSPLQWYAFWAVLIIGGVTILLSILQLVVGCLQLAWTIR